MPSRKFKTLFSRLGLGRMVTLSGLVLLPWTRDHRWDRVEKAYRVITEDGEGTGQTALEALLASYDQDVNDEFVRTRAVSPRIHNPWGWGCVLQLSA